MTKYLYYTNTILLLHLFLLGGNVLYEEAVHYQSHIVLPDPGDVAPHSSLVDDQVHPPS